ncbi:MAG: DUF1254 domain-containing protein [Caulobacteraceae bacterium]
MDRRRFLWAGAALAGWSTSAHAEPLPLRQAAMEAWLYCLPLIEMAVTRGRQLEPRPGGGGPVTNAFNHVRNLAGPNARAVTTPNVDTLYSTAWLDLQANPVTLTIPPSGDRYISVALMDMFSNNFAVLGTRTLGNEGATFTITGPLAAAPLGAIRAPTPWVWVLARTLVTGPDDLDAARAVQDGLRLQSRNGRIPAIGPTRESEWNEYFARAQDLLRENPPPATDLAFFRRIVAVQLGAYGGFERARFTEAEIGEITAGVADAKALLAADRPIQPIDGWTYPPTELGDFGQNYRLRAATALGGLAALPPVEAMYMRAISPAGAALFDGPGRWSLHIPKDMPTDGFWSLTMYEATPDGQYFLTNNPINRYAIGDRTPGLVRNPDGSADIWIGRGDPGGVKTANWLPAPATGPYAMTMRVYLPKQELLTGRWHMPALQSVGMVPPAPAPAPATPAPPTARRRRRRR